jgi:polyphenol oxidase
MSKSRRSFFRKSGFLAGGVAGISFAKSGRSAHAQAPDPMQDCSPFPPPPAVPGTFTPDTSIPVRTRLSAFELPDSRIGQLRLAYKRLRALTDSSPNDPRGWLRQANVHCWYCGGDGNGASAGPEVHGSWRFLPWHRMFLYFHERILGELVGDTTLTLPFWDWDTPGRDRLPPIYADPGPQDDPNPLFDQNRGVTANDRIPPGIVDKDAMQSVLSPFSFEEPGGFGGTPDGIESAAGTLENSPHGPVHIWTGDPSFQAANPDMGVLATAARDPVFFAHHANIDRIWDVWLNLGETRSNPQESAWALESFGFYTQSAMPQWVTMTIGDTVNHEASLRYVYQGTPNPAISPALMAMASAAPQQGSGTIDVSPQSRETIKVAIVAEPEAQQALPTAPRKRVYVLHIDGIEIPADEHTFLRVFLDQPDANPKTPISSPGFVGQFAILAMNKGPNVPADHQRPAHKHVHNKAFILNSQQVELLKGKKTVDVKLVAVGGKLTKIPYRRAYISIRNR